MDFRAQYRALFVLFLSIFSSSAIAHLKSGDEGYISVVISEKGLDFVKDLLIEKAVNSLTPLELPNIEKSVKIPFIGGVYVTLSNITLLGINVSSSTIHPGETGILIDASGATASLSMEWRYSYSTWLLPIEVSDSGNAHIEVDGMEIGLTMSLKNENGNLKLTALDCGCYMEDIIITLDGGASWFYQGLVDAFEDQIRSTVEKAITQKIFEGILKLDTLLQNIPNEVKVNDVLSMNVTFMDDPLLENASVEFDINGLFVQTYEAEVPKLLDVSSQLAVRCGPSKMLGISLDEDVLNSASALYYNAGLMHVTVDKVPDQSFLNTASWKFIIPQLYKKYPNDEMKLNISLTSAPIIDVSSKSIGTTIYSDMTIDVLDNGETISVACISVTITASGFMKILGNNLAGEAKLEKFSLKQKWSNVGNFYMYLIEKTMQVLLNTVLMPYVNLQLQKGFPLPIIHGFTVQNASIFFTDSTIVVCSDVLFTGSLNLMPLRV